MTVKLLSHAHAPFSSSKMVKKTLRIFRSKFGDISKKIDNPGPIANALFGEGLITREALDRALMNNVVAFERTGPLLRAVVSTIDTDPNEPVIFDKLCQVLMSFSETETIGIAMYKEYCKFVIGRGSHTNFLCFHHCIVNTL